MLVRAKRGKDNAEALRTQRRETQEHRQECLCHKTRGPTKVGPYKVG
jgi:hypothetical protein